MSLVSADELVPLPTYGRVFGLRMRPGLADCAPSGRMRLDAIARWMQDVAYADVDDAGVAGNAFWILRRTRVKVNRFPLVNEPYTVRTFCSGVGRLVAERRTIISPVGDDARADVETASLWVHLDPATRHPSRITQEEYDRLANNGYGERHVSHRLKHASPDLAHGVKLFDWSFRRMETDVADHVNNAAYWAPFEEELLAITPAELSTAPAELSTAPAELSATPAELSTTPAELSTVDAELEFRNGAQPGLAQYMADGSGGRYMLDADGGLLATMALISPGGAGEIAAA